MNERGGFALAASLAATVLLAVLVTGALFASMQETHATRSELLDQQVFAYAERAAITALDEWDGLSRDSMPVPGVTSYSPAGRPPLGATVFVTRLDSALYLIVAEGTIAASDAVGLGRRVSITVRTTRDSSGVSRATRVHGPAWAAIYQM